MTKAIRRKAGGFFVFIISVERLVITNRLDCAPCVR
jgi:hypothetical protein